MSTTRLTMVSGGYHGLAESPGQASVWRTILLSTMKMTISAMLVAWSGHALEEARLPSPPLAKLLAIGTEHVYADTADVEELQGLLSPRPGALIGKSTATPSTSRSCGACSTGTPPTKRSPNMAGR